MFKSEAIFMICWQYRAMCIVSVGAGCSQLLSDMQAFKASENYLYEISNFAIILFSYWFDDYIVPYAWYA